MSGQQKSKTGLQRRRLSGRSGWGMLCLGACLAVCGCAQGWVPGSFSSLKPGTGISGQWEPDVDYEAEYAAQQKAKQ